MVKVKQNQPVSGFSTMNEYLFSISLECHAVIASRNHISKRQTVKILCFLAFASKREQSSKSCNTHIGDIQQNPYSEKFRNQII